MLEPIGIALPVRPGAAGCLERIALGCSFSPRQAHRSQRTSAAVGRTRGTDGCAEVHHCLSKIAGALAAESGCRPARGSPAVIAARVAGPRTFWRPRVRHCRRRRPRAGQRRSRRWPRRCSGRCPGSWRRPDSLWGNLPAKLARHPPGAGDKIAGAGIIAQAGPRSHHLGLVGRRERFDARPATGKSLEIGPRHRNIGLLQHDLGQPHPIGVGCFAIDRAPGQSPFIHSIPAQKARRGIDGHVSPMPCSGEWANRTGRRKIHRVRRLARPARACLARPEKSCRSGRDALVRWATCCRTSAAPRSAASASSSPRWSAAGGRSSASATPASPRPNRSVFRPASAPTEC